VTSRQHYDALVIGTPCVDLIFGGMPNWPVPGQEMYVKQFALGVGGIFNTAATLSRLGLRVALLTELGNDFFSKFIFDELAKASISRDLVTVCDRPMFSLSVSLSHDGERGFVSYSNTGDGIVTHLAAQYGDHSAATEKVLPDFRAALDSCSCDALFCYASPEITPVANMMAERGVTIFYDTGWDADELSDPLMRSAIARGQYLLPNLLEATYMTGTETAEAAARALAMWLPTAVVKMGARGVVACRGDRLIRCPAYPIKEVVDTTGAGDAFNGGFIYGILKGYALDDALRCGTICGSLSTTALTGTAAVPTADELERLRAIFPTII